MDKDVFHWTQDSGSSQNFCFGYLCEGNAKEARWQHMHVQEPHADLTWVGGCEGPCPTKQAAVHGPMRPHLPAATTTSAGIILLFLSLSRILSWLLYTRLNSIQENKKRDSSMFNDVFPCVGLRVY